jgi:flagellar hook-length control protein FliK
MNSNGQGLDTNPLLASSLASSQGGLNQTSSNPLNVDNALNTKEFSDAMDKHRAAEKVAASSRSDNTNSEKLTTDTPVQGVLTAESSDSEAVSSALQLGSEGNFLPVDGDRLPLIRPFVEELDSVGFRISSDIASRNNDELLSPESDPSALDLDATASNLQAGISQTKLAADLASQQSDVRAGARSATAELTNAAAPGEGHLASTLKSIDGNRTTGMQADAFGVEGLRPLSLPAATGNIVASATASNSLIAGGALSESAQTQITAGPSNSKQFNELLVDTLDSRVGRQSLGALSTDSVIGGQDVKAQAAAVSLAGLGASQIYQATHAEALPASNPVAVGKPGWSDAVMQRVMWMSSQNVNRVDIALDPPELGPLQVRIVTQSDQTSVVFTSNNVSVREALDQSLPRLREMIEGQGLNLTDVNVSNQSANGQQQDSAANSDETDRDDHVSSSDQINGSDLSEPVVSPVRLSLVDQYV